MPYSQPIPGGYFVTGAPTQILSQAVRYLLTCLLFISLMTDKAEAQAARLFAHHHCWNHQLELKSWLYRAMTAPFSPEPWLNARPVRAPQQRWRALDAKGNLHLGPLNEAACIEDRLTGLIWATGRRSGFVRWGNGSISDYVNQASADHFCGIKRWRLPERDELATLVSYGSPPATWDQFNDLGGDAFAPTARLPLYRTMSWTQTRTMWRERGKRRYWTVDLDTGFIQHENIGQALLVKESACYAFGQRFWK